MMKRLIYPALLVLVLLSCQDDEKRLFDKTADERAAEAIAALEQDLIEPPNGWILRYKPQDDAGSYYVLLDFNEDHKVVIKTDLGAENGRYFEDTISFRVDNSLGLELILENYSFFGFLFEQDFATFGAEYEFDFVNKTPDNALVFRSKTDVGDKGIVTFEQASADDANLLGITLATNLTTIADDLDKFTSSLRLTFNTRDLVFYIALDEFRRAITINAASLKSNTATTQTINFTTGYLVEADKIILEDPFEGTILGNAITIESLSFNTLSESTLSVCPDPITIHSFSGTTSGGDNFILETSLIDVSGRLFAQLSDFYVSSVYNVFNNGVSTGPQIEQDVTGAAQVQLYYGYDLGDGTLLYAIGFFVLNADNTATFLLREFTPQLIDNNIVFNFAPDISVYGNADTDAVPANANTYIEPLASGDKTYVFQLEENLFEFYNPCSGWSMVFFNANQ